MKDETPLSQDARLAWFVANHFDPSLVLPTPTTTSALPLPAVPES